MAESYDVVVVGARCAGSPLATLLARKGLRVLLVDKAEFPSDTPSTHIVQPCGVQILDELGALDRLLAVTPPMNNARLMLDDVQIEFDDATTMFGAPLVNARRVTMDQILLDVAAESGAEVRTGTAVTGLLDGAGRVRGVRTDSGDVKATLVVGADGCRSSVARLVGAEEYLPTRGRAFLWGYFQGAVNPGGGMWLGQVGDRGFLASPTDDGLFMAATAMSPEFWHEASHDLDSSFRAAVSSWPELEAVLAPATRVGRFQTMANWRGYFRDSAGPGWVLVGDAGHFKDPTPGQGISDALRQAVRLAGSIETALGGPSPDEPLRDWWRWRDADAMEMYWFAAQMGAPGPAPLVVQEMQAVVAEYPEKTEALAQIFNHDLRPNQLFTPILLVRGIARALRNRPGRRREILREARALLAGRIRQEIATVKSRRRV